MAGAIERFPLTGHKLFFAASTRLFPHKLVGRRAEYEAPVGIVGVIFKVVEQKLLGDVQCCECGRVPADVQKTQMPYGIRIPVAWKDCFSQRYKKDSSFVEC